MPGAYSKTYEDACWWLVEAGASPEVVAEEFMVGRSSVYR